MKVTYMERLEERMAWSRKMYCPNCGGHEYTVIEQLEPKSATPWTVRCPQCYYETLTSPTRDLAIVRWKQC